MTLPDLPQPNTVLEDGDAELLEAKLLDAVRVVPEALEEEFVRCPGDIAYWTARYARALKIHLTATARRKKLQGLLRIKARQEIEEELAEEAGAEAEAEKGGKKGSRKRQTATESMVDARVETYREWQDAQMDEIEAEVEKERMKGAIEAMRAKKDMLVQMGANHRLEMENDPMIRQRMHAAREGG